jgi:hypothetical protein
MPEIRAPYLRLVDSIDAELEQTSNSSFQENSYQALLFPMMDPSLLLFINIQKLSADNFVRLLDQTKPTWLIDIRPAPRFDLPKFNRKMAFDVFNTYTIKYYDMAGLAELRSVQESISKLHVLADSIQSIINDNTSIKGPLALLFDDPEVLSSAVDVFPKLLNTDKKTTWRICLAE